MEIVGEIIISNDRASIKYVDQSPVWEMTDIIQWATAKTPKMSEAIFDRALELHRVTFDVRRRIKDGVRWTSGTQHVGAVEFNRP